MRFVWGMLGGLLLAIPAFVNGAPLLYPDTLAYLKHADTALSGISHGYIPSQWAEQPQTDPNAAARLRPVVAADPGKPAPTTPREYYGRSIYFGLAELLPMVLFGWRGAVVLNGMLTGCMLAVVYFSALRLSSLAGFLAICLMLAVASAAAPFTALLLPDFLTSLLILAVASVLAFSTRLAVADWLALGLIAALATISHDTNLALAIVGSAICAALLLFRRRIALPIEPALALCLGLVLIGSTANYLYGRAALAHTGQPAMRFPFLTAHLQQLPVGYTFLRQHCRETDLLLCRYKDQVPQDWQYFLFGGAKLRNNGIYAAMDYPQREMLEAEQRQFAMAVLRAEPLRMIGSLMAEGIRQNFVVSYENIIPDQWAKFVTAGFPHTIVEAQNKSFLRQNPGFLTGLWEFHAVVVIGSLAFIVVWLFRRQPSGTPIRVFVAAVVLGAILNAFLCGILASPYPRFEARVTWLFPLLAMLLLAEATESEGQT